MLNSKKISYLKALSHHKKPIVTIGNKGLTDNVIKEIQTGLEAHELIKIQILNSDKNVRINFLEKICNSTGAHPITHIGKLLVIFLESKKSLIQFPD